MSLVSWPVKGDAINKPILYRELTTDIVGMLSCAVEFAYFPQLDGIYLAVRCCGVTSEASYIWELLDQQGQTVYFDTSAGNLTVTNSNVM